RFHVLSRARRKQKIAKGRAFRRAFLSQLILQSSKYPQRTIIIDRRLGAVIIGIYCRSMAERWRTA
ncbi:hypothetical protein, partial [Anaerotruncus colihominis]|uniref:hypothetical protein n=1 Tax=Anaerotruncus colihominis TaxID=169435 RepID=UPI001A9C2184